MIQISHDYPDKSIFLDVYKVTKFAGDAQGKEGQAIRWIEKQELLNFKFPAANRSIINATQLPSRYLITPEPDFDDRARFLDHIEKRISQGINLLQFRAKTLSERQLKTVFQEIQSVNNPFGATIYINTSLQHATEIGASYIHLSSTELMKTAKVPSDVFVAASCHNADQINHANDLGIQFIVLSPVLATTSHPTAKPLSWVNFTQLCKLANMPTYALGGMQIKHLAQAKNSGAQGIAAIRSLW